jgi:hypothetical protein
MRILTSKKISFFLLLGLFISFQTSAQDKKTTLNQDSKFEDLLNEKIKLNSTKSCNDCFKIQIFTGENEESKKALTTFRSDFKNIDATIVFNTPIYKVWVGNFETRIQAEKKIIELKKKYPNAILIRPNR